MAEKCDVAILGASGLVGETMVELLHERAFPAREIHLLASERSLGKKIKLGEQELPVQDAAGFDFSRVQVALFSAGASVSEQYAPRAADAGCVVIDNTSRFRQEPDVPLVVPEVNPWRIADYRQRNIIANPNCSTIQMVVALKPLHDAVGITRIHVATYQSVSGAGRRAAQELQEQSIALLNGRSAEPEAFPTQIAFNVLPHIDSFDDSGFTREEIKMVQETQKILEDDSIGITPTCVRVPVFCGHAEAIHIETRSKLGAEDARQLLREAPGVLLLDEREDGGYPTPAEQAAGSDAVYVGRVREDLGHPNGLALWVVSDNLRKGAALNSIEIAEILLREHL